MADFGTIALIGSVLGGVVSAAGTIAAAKAQEQALDYQAKQLEIKGKEEQAAAYFEAEQNRKEKEFAQSSLQARSAASGFSATDPTSLQIGSDIEKYGTLKQMMAAYGGASRRAGLEAEAVGRRAEGDAIVQGAGYSAFGSILGGITSGFARFSNAGGSFSSGRSNYRYG